MRIPEYISPSALKTFEQNADEYYLKYLADNRPPRSPQTQPMSVGSAFDAFVKSFLHNHYHGNYGPDNAYERDAIFESQVDEHNRDWARVAGEHVYRRYSRCGALKDLMSEINTAIQAPRFEFDLQGIVSGVPVLGKPDIYFTNSEAARVIFDWKVNGYCSKSSVSPVKGYLKVRDTWNSLERKPSRINGVCHKDCVPVEHLGLRINGIQYMEDCNSEWADQLAIYGWLLGEPVGSENLIVGIDQIACLEPGENGVPWMRVANHRTRVSSEYQFQLEARIKRLWNCITSGHFFPGLSREESEKRCADLEAMAAALSQTDDLSTFVNEVSREWL